MVAERLPAGCKSLGKMLSILVLLLYKHIPDEFMGSLTISEVILNNFVIFYFVNHGHGLPMTKC